MRDDADPRPNGSISPTAEWVCRQNLRNFQARLAHPLEEREHAILLDLIARESARLERLLGQDEGTGK